MTPMSRCAIVLLLAAAGLARADDADDRIRGLVEQLADGEPGRREEAAQALVEIGPVAEPAVRRALGSANPEVRERADLVLDELLARWTLAPSAWVRLPEGPVLLPTLLEDLRIQARRPVEAPAALLQDKTWRGPAGVYPMWQALDLIAEASGCHCSADFRRRIRFSEGADSLRTASYSGPFRAIARMSGHDAGSVDVEWEPHVRLLAVDDQVKSAAAFLDNGRMAGVRPTNGAEPRLEELRRTRDAIGQSMGRATPVASLAFECAGVPPEATHFSSLDLTWGVLLATEQEEAWFGPGVTKKEEQVAAGPVTVTVGSAQPGAARPDIDCRVEGLRALKPYDSPLAEGLPTRILVTVRVRYWNGFEEELTPRMQTDTTDDVFHFRLRASELGPEAEAIGIAVATRSTYREVSFSFHDVRLPAGR